MTGTFNFLCTDGIARPIPTDKILNFEIKKKNSHYMISVILITGSVYECIEVFESMLGAWQYIKIEVK